MSDMSPPPPPPGFPPAGPPPGFPPSGPPPGYTPYGSGIGGPPKTSGMAIASLVCGIIGLGCFGIILGIVAIALSIAAKKQIAQSNGSITGGGLATAGLVTGIVGIVGWIGYIALVL